MRSLMVIVAVFSLALVLGCSATKKQTAAPAAKDSTVTVVDTTKKAVVDTTKKAVEAPAKK